MFLNMLPIISFLIISWMLCSADEFVKKKLFPEFLSNSMIAGILGFVILFWGLFQFYANFNYLLYQFRYNYISVVLRFIIILYFIATGFVLTYKGFGEKLYTKSPKSQENYQKAKVAILSLQSLLAKIGLLLMIITIINYFLSIIDLDI